MHVCVGELGHHWFRWWLVAWLVPSHYMNQCLNVVNWTLRNKLQLNLNWNSFIFIQENAFENVVWKMAAILSWPQCVKEVIFHIDLAIVHRFGHPRSSSLTNQRQSRFTQNLLPKQKMTLLVGILNQNRFYCILNTVWCRYNAVNFLQIPHKKHPIARPWGRDMRCLLWV